MSRSWSGRYRRRSYVRRPRSLFRKILDYALAIAVMVMLLVVSVRLDRVETRQTAGAAVINDGDSITLGAERIRMRGIDAPEFTQICQKDGVAYPCGRRSRDALVRLIAGKPVACTGWERDRYDRLLGDCTAGGIDLNRRQVEAGWAIAYGDYYGEESAAREKKLGLWAGSFDRPRDWRDTHGEMVESEHDASGKILNWLRAIFRFS